MRQFVLPLLLWPAIAACTQPAQIEVQDAWARDSLGNTANAAVFMTIRSQTADRLVAASTPVAGKTDLMTMVGGSAAMEMKYLGAIDIPAGRSVSLDPTGLHVWLAGLKQPLRAGQSFPLTLEFENAGQRQIVVTIIKPAAAPPMSGMGM